MKAKTRGQRYVLLLYQRSMDGIWPAALFLGLLLMAGWYFSGLLLPDLTQFGDAALFIGGIVALAIAVFTLVSRNAAHVQPFADHFRIVTPFLRLKVSYRRVTNVRATQLQALFSPQKLSGGERSYLEPFLGATIVVVDLSEYPFNQRSMRMFLPKQFFSPERKGLVLVIRDWMGLSQELDHFNQEWRQSQLRKQNRPTSGYSILSNLSDDR